MQKLPITIPKESKGHRQQPPASIWHVQESRNRKYIEETFGYDLNRTCDGIRPGYTFDVSCQGSVPEAIIAFLESDSFEQAIRLAVSLGGDADTMGAIAGDIAEAYYKEIPAHIYQEVLKRLPEEFINVMLRFYERNPYLRSQ